MYYFEKPIFKNYIQIGRKLNIENLIEQLVNQKLTGKYQILEKSLVFELKTKKEKVDL